MVQFSTFQFSESSAMECRRMAESLPPQKLAAILRGMSNESSLGYSQMLAHSEFVNCGQPYCKVFPRMARSLAGINLTSVPVPEFVLPFPAFEIRLPRPDWPGSLLVYQILDPSIPQNLCFILQQQNERNPLKTSIFQGCFAGHSNLQEVIDMGIEVSKGEHSLDQGLIHFGDTDPDLLLIHQCWSLAIATSLFISDKHDLVCPDLEPRLIRHHGKHFGKHGIAVQPTAALSLGQEIELPRAEYEYLDQHGDGTGRGLNHSHWRCAHYRQQPCGPEQQDRKRIYIGPTIIRPDLPPSTRGPGFKITDRP